MFGEPLMKLGDVLLYSGAKTFDVAGSGPAIWASCDSRAEAESLLQNARTIRIGDFAGSEAELVIVRTLGAGEAKAVTD